MTNKEDTNHPKVFISYSWTSKVHEEWVYNLAAKLRTEHGIDVIFDKWELELGHDLNYFMEQIVSDDTINKVLIICDNAYREKAKKRAGGVGTEYSLITNEIAGKMKQEKFIPVFREQDDDGFCVPGYLKGRVGVNLCIDDDFTSTDFQKLVDNIRGNKKYHKPPVSTKESLEIGAQITIVNPQANQGPVLSQYANNDKNDNLSEHGRGLLKCMKNSGEDSFKILIEEGFEGPTMDSDGNIIMSNNDKRISTEKLFGINTDKYLRENLEELCAQNYLRQDGENSYKLSRKGENYSFPNVENVPEVKISEAPKSMNNNTLSKQEESILRQFVECGGACLIDSTTLAGVSWTVTRCPGGNHEIKFKDKRTITSSFSRLSKQGFIEQGIGNSGNIYYELTPEGIDYIENLKKSDLSDQAESILKQYVKSGVESFNLIKTDQEVFLKPVIEGNKINKPKYLEEDVESLVEKGYLRKKQSSGKSPFFTITRAGEDYAND